jgi:hypothetical protein
MNSAHDRHGRLDRKKNMDAPSASTSSLPPFSMCFSQVRADLFLVRRVSIPSSVVALADDCFSQCTSVLAVSFESGSQLLSIGDSAFESCSRLSSICIPSSVEKLGQKCFCRCGGLSTVNFECGCKLSSIGDSVFEFCSSLDAKFEQDLKRRISRVIFESGIDLFQLEDRVFWRSSLASIYIPSAVTSLGASCFEGCDSQPVSLS